MPTSDLQIVLFGTPQILLHGEPIAEQLRAKAQALLFFLAVTQQPHNRDSLASLLWPEASTAQARKNLRNRLSELRKLLGDYLTITRQTIAFDLTSNYWLDTALFPEGPTHEQAKPSTDQEHDPGSGDLTQTVLARHQAAIQHYHGDFLEGFHIGEAITFEEWVTVQRELFRERMLTMLWRLATHYQTRAESDYAAGLHYCTRLLEMDAWNEDAHRLKMIMLASSGQRSAALAQYESCRQIFLEEFGVEPTTETQTVYEQIRRGELEPAPQTSQVHGPLTAPLAAPASEPAQPPSTGSGDAGQAATKEPETPERLLDLIEMPASEAFYGRAAELAQVESWIIQEQSRLVTILGIGGQGKTALAAHFVERLKSGKVEKLQGGKVTDSSTLRLFDSSTLQPFSHIIWRSLLNAPPLTTILRDWVQLLSAQEITDLPEMLDEQLRLLIELLSQARCLLILDNAESIMQGDTDSHTRDERPAAGYYREGYDDYGQMIKRMATSQHQSCLLITSREKPKEVPLLETGSQVVYSLQLEGLPADVGQAMLQGVGVQDNAEVATRLVQRYSGNPLALKLVAATVQDLYFGDTQTFLEEEVLIFDDIRNVLDQQFGRLLPLEQELLLWLAVEREPVSGQTLWENLAQPPARKDFLEALRSLQRRSLLEQIRPGQSNVQDNDKVDNRAVTMSRTQQGVRFSLQNVVTEYLTELLVDTVGQELETGDIALLNRYALVKAHSFEYIKESQRRLILQPAVQQLVNRHGQLGAIDKLQHLLDVARAQAPHTPGYAGANILHFLLHVDADMRDSDFSALMIWQADLSQADLSGVNLTNAMLRDSIFKDSFGTADHIAISPDGQLLATATDNDGVWIWRVANRQPCGICQGGTETINSICFSPDGQTLASGGSDQIVRLWDMSNLTGTVRLQATLEGHTAGVSALAFRHDGRILASGGWDQTIILWELAQGNCWQTLTVDTSRIRALAFSPDGRYLAYGRADCVVQLWDVAAQRESYSMRGHAEQVSSLAFTPDSQLLASSSTDYTVRIWSVANGRQLAALQASKDPVQAVAFSPDGQFLASAGDDWQISLWNIQDAVNQGQRCRALLGHTEPVWGLAFSPDGKTIISGGRDYSIRVWEVETGNLLHTLRGHAEWIFTLAFSPDGHTLASAGTNPTIHLWDVENRRVIGKLQGHHRQVIEIDFSPDGCFLASSSADQTIRIWDIGMFGGTNQLLHILRGHHDWVHSVAFNPRLKDLTTFWLVAAEIILFVCGICHSDKK